MRLMDYMKDRIWGIMVVMGSFGFVGFTLGVMNINGWGILFIQCILISGFFIFCLLDFLKRQSFYSEIATLSEEMDRRYLEFEILNKPDFREGMVVYDWMKQASMDMNREVGIYKNASQEYRDYIELWIHEVKTPLATCNLITQNNRSEAMESIREELQLMEGYLEQVLYYARSNSVSKDYIIRETTLKNLVVKAVKMNAKAFIKIDLSPEMADLDFPVFTDEKWMIFILNQIIGNSLKYLKKEERPIISIWGKKNQHSVSLIIQDNGVGIPASDVRRVFEKGYTGENGRIYGKSTGMGLYLAKKLCEKMDLGINLESEAGNGTKVIIQFPLNYNLYADLNE